MKNKQNKAYNDNTNMAMLPIIHIRHINASMAYPLVGESFLKR